MMWNTCADELVIIMIEEGRTIALLARMQSYRIHSWGIAVSTLGANFGPVVLHEGFT